eukprot:752744_1
MNRNHQMEREEINSSRTNCSNEEEKSNTGGRSTSNGALTIRRKEETMKPRCRHEMEEGITEVEKTWKTRRLEGNAHEKEGLGFGMDNNAMQLFKEDPMQQLSNTTSPCSTFAL